MKKKIVIIILLVLLGVWIIGPFALPQGNTDQWRPGYASPKQYYEENGEILKGTTKTIDGISYTFDDLGSAMQNENNGQWINDTKYQLDSGIELKKMWYEINGNWYYFNNKGNAIKNHFIKVKGKRYALDDKGALRKVYFKIWGHNFGTEDDGVIIERGGFFTGKKHIGEYYSVFFRGHGIKRNTRVISFVGEPTVMWDEKFYSKNQPEYFWGKDYKLVGTTVATKESDPEKNGESFNGVADGSQIYIRENNLENIYIYDRTDNSFYGYVLSE